MKMVEEKFIIEGTQALVSQVSSQNPYNFFDRGLISHSFLPIRSLKSGVASIGCGDGSPIETVTITTINQIKI